jgi:hypothetical protein
MSIGAHANIISDCQLYRPTTALADSKTTRETDSCVYFAFLKGTLKMKAMCWHLFPKMSKGFVNLIRKQTQVGARTECVFASKSTLRRRSIGPFILKPKLFTIRMNVFIIRMNVSENTVITSEWPRGL